MTSLLFNRVWVPTLWAGISPSPMSFISVGREMSSIWAAVVVVTSLGTDPIVTVPPAATTATTAVRIRASSGGTADSRLTGSTEPACSTSVDVTVRVVFAARSVTTALISSTSYAQIVAICTYKCKLLGSRAPNNPSAGLLLGGRGRRMHGNQAEALPPLTQPRQLPIRGLA